ncbi:MAG: hypothetical protein IPI60_05970 [Saprospiraceae bacterium]|nr:hypothetical protein [Saprospiraceae bacterium]
MLRNLMKNFQFKSDFISRFVDHLNTTFCCKDRLLSLLDSLKNQYETGNGWSTSTDGE